MKRTKRLTKREQKQNTSATTARRPAPAPQQHSHQHQHQHLHCIACGKHLDADVFGEPEGAEFIRCQHGTDFPSCVSCHDKSQKLIEDHDRENRPVQKAAIWH